MPTALRDIPRRPRISIDVPSGLRQRLRLAAANRDMTVGQYLRQAIEVRLKEDLPEDHTGSVLTGKTDPVLAELWDNPKDARYGRL